MHAQALGAFVFVVFTRFRWCYVSCGHVDVATHMCVCAQALRDDMNACGHTIGECKSDGDASSPLDSATASCGSDPARDAEPE